MKVRTKKNPKKGRLFILCSHGNQEHEQSFLKLKHADLISSHGKHFCTAKSMKYGHNKQFKILQPTAAAMPCEINEGAHQCTKRNVEDYSCYAFITTKSINNKFQNCNMQTPFHGKHY